MIWFDIIFVFIFLGLELLYYMKFRSFEDDVHNQLAEIAQRLEIAIERIDTKRKPRGKTNKG